MIDRWMPCAGKKIWKIVWNRSPQNREHDCKQTRMTVTSSITSLDDSDETFTRSTGGDKEVCFLLNLRSDSTYLLTPTLTHAGLNDVVSSNARSIGIVG